MDIANARSPLHMRHWGFPTQNAPPTESTARPSGRRMLETTMQIAQATDMGCAKPTTVAVMSILEHARRGGRVHALGRNFSERTP